MVDVGNDDKIEPPLSTRNTSKEMTEVQEGKDNKESVGGDDPIPTASGQQDGEDAVSTKGASDVKQPQGDEKESEGNTKETMEVSEEEGNKGEVKKSGDDIDLRQAATKSATSFDDFVLEGVDSKDNDGGAVPEPPRTTPSSGNIKEEQKEEILFDADASARTLTDTTNNESNNNQDKKTSDNKHPKSSKQIPTSKAPTLDEVEKQQVGSSSNPKDYTYTTMQVPPPPPEALPYQRDTPSLSSENRRMNWILLGIFSIVLLLAALLGVTTTILVELHDDDSNVIDNAREESSVVGAVGGGDGVDVDDLGEPDGDDEDVSPTPNIFVPPPPPSAPPAPPITATDCSAGFSPLAGKRSANQLFLTLPANGTASTLEEEVTLPFSFPFLGSEFNTIYASPNGHIRFHPFSLSNAYCESECSGIAIAQRREVVHETFQGDIWTRSTGNSFTISWENVGFDGLQRILINAQITLYPSGNIDLCYGENGSIPGNMYAGIWLYTGTTPVDIPVISTLTDPDGLILIDRGRSWPGNQCQFYLPRSQAWTDESRPGCSSGSLICQDTVATDLPIQAKATHTNMGTANSPELSGATQEMSCPGFDLEAFDGEAPIWFHEVQGDGSCACLELRSDDGPFVVGLFRSGCDSLSCFAETDFTSSSILWRTSDNASYHIIVSVLGLPEGVSASYSLSVTRAEDSMCSVFPGTSRGLPGSCPPHVLQQ